MDALVVLAKNIAYYAHAGQFRRDGTPYFMHPLRISEKCTRVDFKVVALLHDVLEDTSETSISLVEKGIPEELVQVVELLSKSQHKSYSQYLKSIKQNNMALEVKKFDMLDNMCDNPTQKQLLKYSKALVYLFG